ncbi:hypothetical protein CVT24_002676 [Panaeolus cyanescens]|uniref:Queuosine 5'-phosphate N-glycosylase/hydrolase n=1 Tax=Panaeolus cyanescens TaxID=181874 RepID=A0A409WBD0_9AGAR|nr:hypothetical protein CVT24_002676 [Panaeolus cyanescens]
MSLPTATVTDRPVVASVSLSEKGQDVWSAEHDSQCRNPVVESAEFAYNATNLVQINEQGVRLAARHIREKLLVESYTPRTWRTHPLHICPPEPYDPANPLTKSVLNWIFLISSLNFSFWSEKEGRPDRYGVEWSSGWNVKERSVHTGYWSLVAAIDRALAEDIPITDPNFYGSEILCPDSLIEHVFRRADQSDESVPLIKERIAIMREVGYILSNGYGASFKGFLDEFHRRNGGNGTALDLVKMVIEVFPSFRDEVYYENKKVCFWKRAQILVAEIWAAFYPASPTDTHPIFPGSKGPEIRRLTMFADYRVPQILHHLSILTYPQSLLHRLHSHAYLPSGSKEEVSLRAASIVSVERVREEILRLITEEDKERGSSASKLVSDAGLVSSVLIDFYLWDLAKKIENGKEKIEGLQTTELVPIHRTRSIWY